MEHKNPAPEEIAANDIANDNASDIEKLDKFSDEGQRLLSKLVRDQIFDLMEDMERKHSRVATRIAWKAVFAVTVINILLQFIHWETVRFVDLTNSNHFFALCGIGLLFLIFLPLCCLWCAPKQPNSQINDDSQIYVIE